MTDATPFDGPSPVGNEHSIYGPSIPDTLVDHLYRVIGLAAVGVAATDSSLDVRDLNLGHRVVMEAIHEAASRAIDAAEELERRAQKAPNQACRKS
jgi:hypothetical protein